MSKRFRIKDSNSHYVGYDIIDDDTFYKRYYGGRLIQAEELCALLNELNDENEQLKKELSDTKHQLDTIFRYRRQMEGIE